MPVQYDIFGNAVEVESEPDRKPVEVKRSKKLRAWRGATQVFDAIAEQDVRLAIEANDNQRKCSSLPRAQTENLAKLSPSRLAQIEREARDAEEVQSLRPKTRGECQVCPTCEAYVHGELPEGEALSCGHDPGLAFNRCRPCPWVGCRHHLAVDVDEETGNVKFCFPHLGIGDFPQHVSFLEHSCALDVADAQQERGGLMEWEDVGRVMNLGVERVRQIDHVARQEISVRHRREDLIAQMRLATQKR
jgi:hypothetical protein